MEVAIRFTPEDLIKYQGAKMKAVDLYLANVPSDGIIIKIRQGDNVIHSQAATSLLAENWIRISLTKELSIDASKDLYVGYEFIQRNQEYVPSVSAGPAKPMKSDLISSEGEPFESLYDLTGGSLDYNWNIVLLIEDNSDVVDIAYNVYRDNVLVKTVKEMSYLDQIMITTACYEVTALYNGELESTPGNISCVTLTEAPKPDAVTDLTATIDAATNSDIDLLWTASIDAVKYKVYRNGELLNDNVVEAVYRDENLVPAEYCYTVIAINSLGTESDPSNEACATIVKPDAASDLTATIDAATNSDIKLLWTANPYAVKYKVYRNGELLNDNVVETTYRDENLVPAEYCYAVIAINSLGIESDPSNAACATIVKPDATSDLAARVENNNNIALNWTANPYAVKYKVYRGGELLNDNVVETTYRDENLTPAEYCYTIIAVNSVGTESDNSNEACAIVKALLTVTVENAMRVTGEANPAFNLIYEGWIPDYDIETIDVLPTAVCEANELSPEGEYEIRVGGGEDDRYRFEYVYGVLTVEKAIVNVTGIRLDPAEIDLVVGRTAQLNAAILPDDATNQNINWTTANAKVATVSANGLVTAVSYGMTTITVSTEDGNHTATCIVNVYTSEQGHLKATEAFTPNGDMINDFFIIEHIEDYPSNELLIFDRSGTLHYSATGYQNNWDGTANKGQYNGSKVPSGTYYYILRVKDRGDIKGFVVIRY
jgi:gliding motility-associated-like protein